jgi:hypothetical protein
MFGWAWLMISAPILVLNLACRRAIHLHRGQPQMGVVHSNGRLGWDTTLVQSRR